MEAYFLYLSFKLQRKTFARDTFTKSPRYAIDRDEGLRRARDGKETRPRRARDEGVRRRSEARARQWATTRARRIYIPPSRPRRTPSSIPRLRFFRLSIARLLQRSDSEKSKRGESSGPACYKYPEASRGLATRRPSPLVLRLFYLLAPLFRARARRV